MCATEDNNTHRLITPTVAEKSMLVISKHKTFYHGGGQLSAGTYYASDIGDTGKRGGKMSYLCRQNF